MYTVELLYNYNELVGTSEIVHNTEVFLLQRLNSTVNAVLGPATVSLIIMYLIELFHYSTCRY